MQRFIQGCCFLYLALFGKTNFAQQVFYLENATAETLTAATYDPSKNAVMFFSGNNVFYYPFGSDKNIVPEWYSIEAIKNVDAALDWDEDNSLFFDGSMYRMFKHSTGEFVTEDTRWPGLPAAWNNKLDGAVKWDKDLIFFFYNNEYVVYSTPADSIVDYNDITTWEGWPAHWNDGIDDAFNPGDGFIYFLRGGEMMPYSLAEKSFFNPLKITSSGAASNSEIQSGTNTETNGTALKPALFVASKKNETNNVSTISDPASASLKVNNSVSISGCVTGSPSGSGLREIQSPVQGDQQGRLFADNLPKGHRIAEIKIYTSKIWGKTVISGIQTILLSSSGQRIEQTALGRKTISEYAFTLDDDECITGISGTKNGESGNFIYSLQVVTSRRTSQVYGERTNEKGRESFSLLMPEQSIFNGFAGNFNNNMTGIGIKYYGQESMTTSSVQKNIPSSGGTNNTSAYSNSNSIPPSANKNTGPSSSITSLPKTGGIASITSGEYLDNYEDYTQSLGNDAMWSVQPMPGLDWLGSGFDILRFDPLNPNETKNRKTFRAIVVTNSGERAGNKAQYLKPFGTEFGSVNSGNDVDSSSWVTSYRSFASSFSVGVSGKVSVPKVASGSLSGSYSEMNTTAVGSESIYYFSKIMRKIHEVDLMQTWRDQFTGQKYKQKLHPSFKDDVAALPVIKGAIPLMAIDQMKKNQSLPAPVEQVKGKYLDLISKYGTHYASHVAWGGQYISRTQIKRSDYEASRMSKTAFTASAEAQIKKVKVGGSVDFSTSEGSTSSTNKSVFRRQTYVQGGNGETDLDKWRDKVDATPAPVEIYFTSFADLMTKNMFPNDPDIEKKSEVLKVITEKYFVDNMRSPVESKDDFFRDLPDLPMPGNISVRNGGGYAMKFTVTYELDGKWETKESGSYTLGMTRQIEIPVDAKTIKLKAEYFGITGDAKVIFEKNFSKPEVKCYKVWGTIFDQGHSECD